MAQSLSGLLNVGIVVFPGTNCDRDTFMVCEEFGWNPKYVWHTETDLNGYQVIFLPGGFSYGDYIRSGRLAKFSPVMQAVKEFIDQRQGIVVGICNGFQILCECGLLPGVLTDNLNTKFICKNQSLNLGNDTELHSMHDFNRKSRLGLTKGTAEEMRRVTLSFERSEEPTQQHGIKEIQLPIAHREGRYLADKDTIKKIKKKI